ncbi:MAG: helix-turn-helix domain-containing protein [Pseudomonadota bacterium]
MENRKHSDLIAIANAELAEKLNRSQEPAKDNKKKSKVAEPRTFKQDIWRAVYTLNLIRYVLALCFIVFYILPVVDPHWQVFDNLVHPQLYLGSTILVLISAIVFSRVSNSKTIEFNHLITAQFSLDVVLAALLTHSAGSIESNMVLLYICVVGCGSVVLPRKQALGLASGAIILFFFEHFYSILSPHMDIEPNYPLLVRYGLLLFSAGLLISYLAERIRIAEMIRYVPGNETIEDFLVREEKNALTAALKKTDGNKTEAAKLLGMTFRSFRYKLTKYDIS